MVIRISWFSKYERMEEIGYVNTERGSPIILKKGDVFFGMVCNSNYIMDIISSIIKNKQNQDAIFIQELLRTIGERDVKTFVNELENSTYSADIILKSSSLKPSQPTVGIIATLLTGKNIQVKKNLLSTEKEVSKRMQIDNLKIIKMHNINEINYEAEHKQKNKFKKEKYKEVHFKTGGVMRGLEIASFLPIPMPISDLIIKYEDSEKNNYLFRLPEIEFVSKKLQKKLIQHGKRLSGEEIDIKEVKKELERIERVDDLYFIEQSLSKNGWNISEIYLDVAKEPNLDLLKMYKDGIEINHNSYFPLDSFLILEKNNKNVFLEIPGYYGVILSTIAEKVKVKEIEYFSEKPKSKWDEQPPLYQ